MVLPVMVHKGISFSKGSLACCTLVHASFWKSNTYCLSVTVDGLDVTRVADLWIFSIGIVHILRLVLIVCCSGAVSFTATADLQHQKMLGILLHCAITYWSRRQSWSNHKCMSYNVKINVIFLYIFSPIIMHE